MITFLLHLCVYYLLAIGSYSDLKTRLVSNKLIGCIALFSLPLIILNLEYITYLHIITIVALLSIYYITHYLGIPSIGGADVKVLPIIILSVTTSQLIIGFLIAAGLNNILMYKYRNGVPFFICITVGYMVTLW